MAFPIPPKWTRDSKESKRDQKKRDNSPSSYFYSQGRSLVLSAEYFKNDRMLENSRGEVAEKHRHKIRLALFGQMMACFEYMFKDFLAQLVDATDIFDDQLKSQKWIQIDVERILGQRIVSSSVGAFLIHPTLGWYQPEQVNERISTFTLFNPIAPSEIPTLNQLWIVRHSVAHNAGFVTSPDAGRIGSADIAQSVVNTDDKFISATFDFLCPIARRLAEQCGSRVLAQWFKSIKAAGADFSRDEAIYSSLKSLSTFIASRPTDLPEANLTQYQADFARFTV